MSNIIKASRITGEYRLKEEIIEQQVCTEIIIDESGERAAAIINQAEQEAIRIKERAQKEIDQAKEDGYNQGYHDGFAVGDEKGRQQGLEHLNSVIKDLQEIVHHIKEELDNRVGDLIKLAVKIANRIVHAELEINPQIINGIVKEMVQDMTNFEEIVIHVNPELEKYLVEEDFKSEFVKQQINFVGDSKLKMGDCIVKTHLGGRDGTIEGKLDLLERELLKEVGLYEGV